MPAAPVTESASDLAALFGGVLLRPLPSGRLALLGAAPPWWNALWPNLAPDTADLRGASLFLDGFLHDADAFWSSNGSEPLASGIWSETATDGSAVLLEAFALRLASGPALLLRPPAVPVREHQHTLQQAREQALAFSLLRRDFQRLEDALACLLHDMNTPLASVQASLEFLHQDNLVLSPGGDLLSIARSQVQRLQAYVRTFFASVVTARRPPLPPDGDFPDLRSVVHAVTGSLRAEFEQRQVRLEVREEDAAPSEDGAAHGAPEASHLRVVAEPVRLERVLVNLLDNALRHSPPGSIVRVTLSPDPTGVRLSVCDQGEGVPESFLPLLFRRAAQGPGPTGASGLGLYFFRVTVEGWGGETGYSPSPLGGARFWCRLARPAPTLPSSPSYS